MINQLLSNMNSFTKLAKESYYCTKRNLVGNLSFNFYVESKENSTSIISYLDEFCLYSSNLLPEKAEFNIFVSNDPIFAGFIKEMVSCDLFSISQAKFIFNQKILAFVRGDIVLFYPINGVQADYPILIKLNNNFFVLNYKYNSKYTEFLFRLIKEIYISFYEMEDYVTYHGNSILLPNNKSVIFIGKSESGKTTLCSGLCYVGKSCYISDDRIMINKNNTHYIPSISYVNINVIEILQMQKIQTTDSAITKSNRAKVPFKFFNSKNLQNSNCTNEIGLFILPKYHENLGSNFKITKIAKSKFNSLLSEFCLTNKETWKDKYMFIKNLYSEQLRKNSSSQIKQILSQHQLLQVDFGPYIDYKLLENQLLDQC